MSSKRFKKLPKKTSELPSSEIDKLLPLVKKTARQSLMSLLT